MTGSTPPRDRVDVLPAAPDHLARWRQLTGSAEWRLTDHFFRALFDFGILTQTGADAFKHGLIFAIGLFPTTALLLTRVFLGKYFELAGATSAEPYRRMLLGDDLLLIGLPMLLVAFVTLLISDSLFPDEPDFRILGPLPVRKSVVFGTKLAALLLFNTVLIALSHLALVPVIFVMSMNQWREHGIPSRFAAWAIASGSASAFAALAITAVVGVLMLVLSHSRLHALTALLRSTVFAVLVSCLPYILYLPALTASLSTAAGPLVFVPPAWFLGLERALLGSAEPWPMQLATIAVGATGAAATVTAVTYALLFRHFERLMLRSGTKRRPWHAAARAFPVTRVTPAFRAVSRFTIATLTRSQLHQSVLLGLSGFGGAIVMNRLIGADLSGWLRAGGLPTSALAGAAVAAPFTLMYACGLGIRAALALPMEQRANWIFRMTEADSTRHEQLRAVNQVVTAYVVYLPVAATFPLLWLTLGAAATVAAGVIGLVGLVFVQIVLLEWRRIPFTCSYLPSKLFVARSLGLIIACLLFTAIGARLVYAASAGTIPAVLIAAVLCVVAYWLRRRRLAMWRETPLMFDDDLDGPVRLNL